MEEVKFSKTLERISPILCLTLAGKIKLSGFSEEVLEDFRPAVRQQLPDRPGAGIWKSL